MATAKKLPAAGKRICRFIFQNQVPVTDSRFRDLNDEKILPARLRIQPPFQHGKESAGALPHKAVQLDF